ncbi:hypothetical protein Fmac_018196 [Flemingia macrophylla]|uniref:Transposase n=1 Tax=Flemingia macrophylla TaxID=520843 RepID=A0ABD1M4A7_9FABA
MNVSQCQHPEFFHSSKYPLWYSQMWVFIVKMEDSNCETVYSFMKLIYDVSHIAMLQGDSTITSKFILVLPFLYFFLCQCKYRHLLDAINKAASRIRLCMVKHLLEKLSDNKLNSFNLETNLCTLSLASRTVTLLNSSLSTVFQLLASLHLKQEEDEITILHVGRQSTHCWTVEAIDFEETIKKIKVKVKGVNNLPRELRIIVKFDDQGQAIGEAQALLAGFLGTLAADCKLFPMDYDRWSGPSGVPKAYFDDCFETILKPRFYFKSNEAIAKRYCKMSMRRKWAANRQSLWNEFNDPTKSRDEIIKNVPIGIDKDQWARFVHYRHKPSTLDLCKRNKEIRNKQVIPHTGGSKANPRRRNELEQIQVGLTQSTVDESEVSPLDVVGRVLGPEHSGRVRCMGLGVVPSNTFRNTRLRVSKLSFSSGSVACPSSSSSSYEWKERHNNLESAFKAYIIMKEGRIPEELATYFTPDAHANDSSSVPNTPLEGRHSSEASNP